VLLGRAVFKSVPRNLQEARQLPFSSREYPVSPRLPRKPTTARLIPMSFLGSSAGFFGQAEAGKSVYLTSCWNLDVDEFVSYCF
jgi:hypothetical protein